MTHRTTSGKEIQLFEDIPKGYRWIRRKALVEPGWVGLDDHITIHSRHLTRDGSQIYHTEREKALDQLLLNTAEVINSMRIREYICYSEFGIIIKDEHTYPKGRIIINANLYGK